MGIVILKNMLFAIACYFCFCTGTYAFGSSLLVEYFSFFCSGQLPSFSEGVYSVQRELIIVG